MQLGFYQFITAIHLKIHLSQMRNHRVKRKTVQVLYYTNLLLWNTPPVSFERFPEPVVQRPPLENLFVVIVYQPE
jgi:hypothetical protein